jgi:hypothetical protein
MKKIILFIILFLNISILTSNAETDEERIRHSMWGATDPEFKETKCDPKWKNESAVILFKKYEYNVRKELIINNIFENVYSHTRILLNDKAAVEKFSTFALDISRHTGYIYSEMEKSVFVGIKVIKPNGTENIIPVDKKLIDQIKSFRSKQEIQKIAISNLEPGDIIDYYIACESQVSGNYLYYGFSPVFYYLSDNYPVQKQKIQLHIMRKCFLSAKSVNGAPEIQLDNTADKNQYIWTLTDINRSKIEDEQFTYLYRAVPSIIFQATFVKKQSLNNIGFFIDKEDKIKNSVSDEDYFKYLKSYTKANYIFDGTNEILENVRKRLKKEKNPDVIIKELFYTMREYYTNYNISHKLATGWSIENPHERYFARLFYKLLIAKKINASICLATPKWLNDFKDVVMVPQLDYIIRAKGNKTYYFSNFNSFTLVDELDPDYQNTTCKYLDKNEKKRPIIATDKIKESSGSSNSIKYDLKINFESSDADKLTVEKTTTATGLCKGYYQDNFISLNDRITEGEKNPYGLKIRNVNSSKLLKRIEDLKRDNYSKISQNVLYDLKSDYGTENVKNTSFKVIQQGRWESAPEFKSTQNFEVNDFISKAGKNIMLEVGKLIGSQIVTDKKDSSRVYDIYISYPKTIEYNIRVEIPTGYKVKGSEKLKYNIKNETGEFSSTAIIDNNELIINVKKYYSSDYFNKDKWSLMTNYLKAAQDFFNQKIVFTKDSK